MRGFSLDPSKTLHVICDENCAIPYSSAGWLKLDPRRSLISDVFTDGHIREASMVVRIVVVHLGTLLKSWKCSEMRHDSWLWWFLVELKMLREGEGRRCVPVEGQAAVPNEIVVLAEVLDADQGVEREPNLDGERTLPRRENGSEWVMTSSGDFFLADCESWIGSCRV